MLVEFNPKVEELHQLVASSKEIVTVNIEDKKQLDLVKEKRIALKNARVEITKKGKELREEAVAFQKAVIAKEKELIGIIEPEEERLQAFEEESKKLSLRKERLASLANRKQMLANIDDGVEVDDEYLLSLDATEFQGYCNKRVAEKNQKIQDELNAREKALKDAEDRVKREAEIKEREELARKQERDRIELEARQKEARELEAKRQEEKRIEDERIAREKDEKYQAFLKDNGYNSDEFITVKAGESVKLYKIVAIFNK